MRYLAFLELSQKSLLVIAHSDAAVNNKDSNVSLIYDSDTSLDTLVSERSLIVYSGSVNDNDRT